MNLKCENVPLWGDAQIYRRWAATVAFVSGSQPKSRANALDLNPGNEFGKRMFNAFGWKYHHTADLDLNIWGWQVGVNLQSFDYLCCFEVIEHLMNAHQFLLTLSNSCRRDVILFLTYPRNPEWLKSDRHWKEFTDHEFQHLCKSSGWRVVLYDRNRGWHDWWFYFTGLRPLLRLWCKLFWLSRNNLFVLRNVGIKVRKYQTEDFEKV